MMHHTLLYNTLYKIIGSLIAKTEVLLSLVELISKKKVYIEMLLKEKIRS